MHYPQSSLASPYNPPYLRENEADFLHPIVSAQLSILTSTLSHRRGPYGCLACILVSDLYGHICVLYIGTLWGNLANVARESLSEVAS